ncbi:hypothetical protein [Wujia sp.]|uniref:hypothetical protein n=1 Tax=Wujia sp. TaxID=2944172 RepID=UPI003F7DA751
MKINDWVSIIVEILGNGIVLAIFGKWLDLKLKKSERKDELHSNTINSFYQELLKLNRQLLKVKFKAHMNNISDIKEIIKLLEDNVLTQWIEVVILYDTYEYELRRFEKEYKRLEQAWNDFIMQTTPEGLDKKLEEFKKINKELAATVNKKY